MTHTSFLMVTLAMLNLAGITDAVAGNEVPAGQAAGTGLFLSHDNEGFDTQRWSFEYMPQYENADARNGARYTAHRYRHGGWARDGQQFSLLHRNNRLTAKKGWQLDAGLFLQGGLNLLTLDGGYRHTLSERTGLEIFINRDWVETAKALDNGIHFNFAGMSLEHSLGAQMTLIGLAARQEFSDGNTRNHGRLKLIWQPVVDSGLTFQARYRAYTSSNNDVTGMYFNPREYNEAMLAAGWRQKMQGWNVNLVAGAGQQKIDDGPYTGTHLLEGSIQNPAASHYSVRLRAGYSQSAAFNGPNYRYSYLFSEWIMRF